MPRLNNRSARPRPKDATRRWLTRLGVGMGLFLASDTALAEPTGGEVLSGSATVTQEGNQTLIETGSPRTRIRWDGFDIAADESVHAQQPDFDSILVNHVPNARATHVDGRLSSNGKIWILNPAGVYFGGSALVEVAGLVAAAGELSDEAFVARLQDFRSLGGEVRNDGQILTTGGDVTLVGRRVANHGQIVTRGGDLVMAAGDDVLVFRHDTHIQVHLPDLDGSPNVENTGTIDTGGGRARLAAGDFLGLAIRNSGEIHARHIALEAGDGSLVSVSGLLDARNESDGGTGGHIEITGDSVSIESAVLDASGSAGGGEIWLGGKPGGEGGLRTARLTFVSGDSQARADALDAGDGGEIVVWSEELASVQGLLSAEGGRFGGNGGFIETSSKGRIDVAAEIRVGAGYGQPGTWLLDPVNVAIVNQAEFDATPGAIEMDEFGNLSAILFQPESSVPSPSLLLDTTLVETLELGSQVLVVTESLDPSDPGDDAGWIEVRTPIEIAADAAVRPGSSSLLELRASDDVRVLHRIASDNPELQLDVVLQANDPSQQESSAEIRNGDVLISAEIETQGGFVFASGTNIVVHANLDTTKDTAPPGQAGGSVSLIATDPVPDGDNSNLYGNVEIAENAQITTGGGLFFSSGELFNLADGARIDVYLPAADPAAGDFDRGNSSIQHRDQVTIHGDIKAESLLLQSGTTGVGDLLIGSPETETTLSAARLVLIAGDATPNTESDAGAQVLIDRSAALRGADGTNRPDLLEIRQDAAIRDQHVPLAGQFGSDVAGMFLAVSSLGGAPGSDPDILFTQNFDRFTGTNLALVAPDSVQIDGEINPHNVEIEIDGDFEVSAALARNLRPAGPETSDGLLRIRAGAAGSGNLDFESFDAETALVAEHIALQAVSGSTESSIDPTGARFTPGASFEIRQDASITDTTDESDPTQVSNVPELSQFTDGIDGLEYKLFSHGGSVRLTDATRVQGSALSLRALNGIELDVPAPIRVERADVGGFNGFEVTQELLDNLDIAPTDGGKTILTLRSGTDALTFQANETIETEGETETVPVQVEVEADRIHLAGAIIDVETGTPLFQSDANTSPERLVFEQDALIENSSLPTPENFPDGLGPSELFVLQSNAGAIALIQNAPQPLPRSQDFRGWSFPIQDETQVVLVAPTLEVQRDDGFDLVLGENDDLWGTQVVLSAFFSPLSSDAEGNPIVDAVVDAKNTHSIRGFDPFIDYLTPDLLSDIQQPRDLEGSEIAASSLTLDQEGDFALRSNPLLPNLDGDQPLEFQPDVYFLRSQLGSIEVDNSLLADTNLILRVDALQNEYIDFDLSGDLTVQSLAAQMGGNFKVGSVENGIEGAKVVAQDRITLASGGLSEGDLSFTGNVELTTEELTLIGGLNPSTSPNSVVDARDNAPGFNVQKFSLVQTGDLRNGLITASAEPLSTLPNPAQFGTATTPLDLYSLQTVFGDLEINDPSEVLIARNVALTAGAPDSAATVTLRADTGTTAVCQSACGTATDPNLVLIPAGSPVESVSISARTIQLEAPSGFVDTGDERVRFDLQDFGGIFGIRQEAAINNASRLPADFQFERQPGKVVLQSLDGISVNGAIAERLEAANLSLIAGLSQERFDAAKTGIRLQDPVPDSDPEVPAHVYDRMADSNGDGIVNSSDLAVIDTDITIDDSVPFDLLLLRLSTETGEQGSLQLGNVHILTEADQSYGSAIQLRGEAELTARAGILLSLPVTETPPASTILFEKPIDGTTAGGESLTVNATGRIQFLEEIGVNTQLAALTLNLEQLIQFDDPPPTSRVEFGSPDFAGTFHVNADNVLLNPDSGDRSSPFARFPVPDSATFFRRGGSLAFTTQNFRMGLNEKLSVDGSELRIDASGGTATIGDLSALDRIDVSAEEIRIQRRQGGSVIRANGRRLEDAGVDFVAGEIDFRFDFDASSDPTGSLSLYRNQQGSGAAARFGINDPEAAPGFMDEFSVLSLEFNLLTGDGLGFAGADLPIDGVPDGISRVELARSYAPDVATLPIAVPASQRIVDPTRLASLGIALRDPLPLELQAAARGAAVYLDLASLPSEANAAVRVSESRLVAEEIEQTLATYERVFGSDGSRAALVQSALQSAVDDYKRSTGARRVVGFELRRYVYNRPSSQFHAYQELQNLGTLFRHHRRSGLTPTEYGPIQLRWLEAVQPDGISLEELSEFVHPSRYVRGSDVLDVFGD
jgi:filamentous hemagglutinin family protein